MKRMMLFLSFTAFLLSAAWAPSYGQKAEIRNFHGTVDQIQKAIHLAWWAGGDDLFVNQILESSTDGVNFKPIAEFPVIAGPEGAIYQYLHTTPILGVNYYRLALMFSNETHAYSEMIKVEYGVRPIYSYPTYPSRPRPGSTPRG